MTHSPHQYAQALCDSLERLPEERHDAALARFVMLVQKNGDETRFRDIVSAVRSELVARRGGREITLTFAREPGREITERLRRAFVREKDEARVSVDPEAIAGVRITVDGEQEMDATFAGRLQMVFAPRQRA